MTLYQHAARIARDAVQYAMIRGKLPRLNDGSIKCTDCPKPATEYDHRDYSRSKWLDVVPVCSGCNKRRGPAQFDGEPVGASGSNGYRKKERAA